jgi:hypothetical protein
MQINQAALDKIKYSHHQAPDQARGMSDRDPPAII